jgi:tetratricopeptide (TPR) repeat protein
VLNPNLDAAWFLGGYLRLFRGESEEAINWFEHAMRLSPLDSEMFRMQTGVTLAHLIARRFDAASSWAKAFRNVPILVLPGAVIAASYALAGRMDEALRAMQHLRKLNPALRLASLEKWLPFQRREDLATFAEGLRRAGVPE